VLLGAVKILQRQADLPHIVRAFAAPRRFASSLNSRQQQRDEDANDGDHHKQLNQGKTV
jgi:hypothetical protein